MLPQLESAVDLRQQERWPMLAISGCFSGFVGPMVAERCFSSAHTATEVTPTVVNDAGRRADANNDVKPTDDISKAPKAGLTIAIASDSIVGDGSNPSNRPTRLP